MLFFLRFFWAFFHSRLAPSIELGLNWPPAGVHPFNPIQIPLLNTIILLSSGATITWAHHALLKNNYTQTVTRLILTVTLGLYFTILQAYEYVEASFTIADSIYGSTFFMATGFHGLHVIIGTIFIIISLTRQIKPHFSNKLNHSAAQW